MELLNIRQGDIGADSVSIRALKGSVSTVKRLSPESVEFLKTLTASSPGLELWRLVRPYSRAGVRKRLQLLNYSMTLRLVGQRMNLHSLRHSWAVLGYQASGGNIIGLQAAMGHRSISSTARYLHYLKGQEISHEVFNIVNNFGKVGS